MKYAILTALLDIEIDTLIEDPIEVSDDIVISNNPEYVKQYINPRQYSAIGDLELNCLLGGSPVLILEKEVETLQEAREEAVNVMRGGLGFLTAIWLEVDNSVNFELGFAVSQTTGHVHSNSLSYHFWTNIGQKKLLKLDQNELAKIAEAARQYFGAIRTEEEFEHTFQRKEVGRINIGVSFLMQARSARDLGMKIANYCSFFEAMLSSKNVELSHQMAERAAFYLCESAEERLTHYRKSKRAYGIRSKVVHGDSVSKNQLKELEDIAEHCDNVARNLMKRMMEDIAYKAALDSNNNEDLDLFMLNIIFGVNTVAE